jgi:hypothetical protein
MNPGIIKLIDEDLAAADRTIGLIVELLKQYGIDPS